MLGRESTGPRLTPGNQTLFSGDPDASEEARKAYDEQKGRVVALFKRQLRQPLLGMENTLEEYKLFVGEDGLDPNILRDYQKALLKLKPREQLGKDCL
jgi:hypothetical protein